MSDLSLYMWPAVYVHLCTHIWLGGRALWRSFKNWRQAAAFKAFIRDNPSTLEEIESLRASFVAWQIALDQTDATPGGPDA